jgi:fatty acid desaturase
VSFNFNWDRWRRHTNRMYGEGKDRARIQDAGPDPREGFRTPRLTRPLALAGLVGVLALSGWLIWGAGNVPLGTLVLIVGGAIALYELGTARPDR